jgi:hypothetical protein
MGGLATNLAGDLASGGPSAPSGFVSLLSPSELWDVRSRAVNNGDWTGQVSSRVLAKTGTIPLVIDTGNFNSVPVYHYDGTGLTRHEFIGTAMALSGTRPYTWMVLRQVGGVVNLLTSDSGFASNALGLQSGTGRWAGGDIGTAFVTPPEAAAHLVEIYLDAAGVATVAVDGAVVKTSGAGQSLAADIAAVAIGGISAAPVGADCYVAQFGIRSAVPSGALRAQLRLLSQAAFGTP